MGIAFLLSCIAAFAVLMSGLIGEDPPAGAGSPAAAYSSFLLTVCGAYFVAGVLSGLAYHSLQQYSHKYLGKVALCFIFGICAYGAMGLGSALAHQYLGLNIFESRNVAEEWASLPWITLALGVMSALFGPVVWIHGSGETEVKW